MSKKQRMKKFRLDEISLVDKPAQAGALVVIAKRLDDNIKEPLNNAGNTVDHNMTDQTEPTVDTVTKAEFDAVQKRADRAEAVNKLSPEQRSHFDSLNAVDSDSFLASDDRDGILKNLSEADPVVYTDMDGNEIRKSEGATVLRLSEQNDTLRKNAATTEAITKRAGFEKRATAELSHLKGTDVAKADLLEAVASLNADRQEAALEILKSKDAGMSKAMSTLGTTDAGNDTGDANAKLDAIAKGILSNDPSLTAEQAFSKALDTTEGRELYSELS